MVKREMHCTHHLPLSECEEHYAEFLSEFSVGDHLNGKIYGKSQEWRDAADKLLVSLAKENKFIVSDMVIIFLESAGYGLEDYTPLGGVFKRAAKRGIIKRVRKAKKQALWFSKVYEGRVNVR